MLNSLKVKLNIEIQEINSIKSFTIYHRAKFLLISSLSALY